MATAPPIKLGASGRRADDLQRGVNTILKDRDFGWRRINVDGKAGRGTFAAAHFALWQMGASAEQLRRVRKGRITDHAFKILTRQIERSGAMKRRDRDRRDEVRRLRRLHEQRGTVEGINIISTQVGEPHLGGADALMDFVEWYMIRRGLPLGSGKRTPAYNASIGGSSTSDHLTTKVTTDARDFPTFSGEDDARALAKAFGNSSWQPNSYATFDVTVDGRRFRIQILWGSAIAHGDHVHVGVSAL